MQCMKLMMLDLEVLLATSSMPTFHKKTQKMLCPAMAIEEEDRFLFQIDCVVILVVPIHLRRGNRLVSPKLRKQFLIKWVEETDHPGHPTIHTKIHLGGLLLFNTAGCCCVERV